MKQILESIFKVTIGNLLQYRKIASNSYNKIENNFYGPINFVNKPTIVAKRKIKSLPKAKKN